MKKKNLLGRLGWGFGLLGLLMMPMAVRADGFSLNANIGGDDQAHYDFIGGMGRHHPKIWRAAQQLRNAKHTLWQARDDFHGHKAEAIQAINAALDQLKVCEQQ
jgi:hypothetical protein